MIGVIDMAEWNPKQAKDSAEIFETTTKAVLEWYFDGIVMSTELHEHPLMEWLDYKCDIDAVVKTKNEIVFGIAHRVHVNYYRTFTIHTQHSDGYLTEIDKLHKDGFKPRYHVKTACKNGKPVEIAIAKSKDLLYAINNGWYTQKASKTGEHFDVLYWDELENHGIHIDIIKL